MAEQEVPLLQTEDGDASAADANVKGPVLDLEMIISRLLAYKNRPGKQVQIQAAARAWELLVTSLGVSFIMCMQTTPASFSLHLWLCTVTCYLPSTLLGQHT